MCLSSSLTSEIPRNILFPSCLLSVVTSMGRKSKAHIRRKEIVICCYRVVDKVGIENTSIRKIAEEMDAAPSMILHYFKSKEELLLALVDYFVESMDRKTIPQFAQLSSAKERLEFHIEEAINLNIAQSIEDKVFYACFYMSLYNPVMRERFIKMYDRDRELINTLICDYLIEEHLPCIDPEPLSREFITFLEGLNFFYALYKDRSYIQSIVLRFKKSFWDALNDVVHSAKNEKA